MTNPPLTDQQMNDAQAIADRAATDPFYVSDCEGSLQVWRESALTHVRRDEAGEITMYSFPSSYRITDQVIELDLNTWDPGEDATDDQQRQDIYDLVEARAALPALLTEVRRLNAELATAREQAIHWAAETTDAKLTAEPDHTRASALYELLLDLRGKLPCTCARSQGLHERECRKYVPGHELISPALALKAYRNERPATSATRGEQ
jgi:hypothetical protein